MSPVTQAPGSNNCFQVCIASILELPIEDCPHIFKDAAVGDCWNQLQWEFLSKFAQTVGYNAFWVDPDTEQPLLSLLSESGLFYIAFGRSPGGNWGHCVVMQNGKYVHDPADRGAPYLIGDPWLYVGFQAISPEVRNTL